jgi:hypothetical protein
VATEHGDDDEKLTPKLPDFRIVFTDKNMPTEMI